MMQYIFILWLLSCLPWLRLFLPPGSYP